MPLGAQSESFKVEGADKLARLSAQLKGADRALQSAMRKRLREAAKPVVQDVKTAAARHSKTIPGSIVAEFRYSEKRAGAYIRAKRSKMPKGKEALPGLMEYGSARSGGRYIRHPVFARKGTSRLTGRMKYRNLDRSVQGRHVTWVNQPTHPFLVPTVTKDAERVRREMTQVLDDVERQLNASDHG